MHKKELTTNTRSLPTINLSSESLKSGTSSWVSASNDVRLALEEYGCFVAVCDDFGLELHNKAFDVLGGLFGLSNETKAKNISNKPYHGNMKPQHPLHLVESFGIEDAQDPQKTRGFTSLMWPSGNEGFRQTMKLYSKLGSQLEQVVKRMVFESYGVENYLQSLEESTTYLLRIARYRGPREDESNIGSVPHSDKSFLTVLHQNEVNGLKVQTKNGHWISYQGSAQTFVVMAGEACLAWSNNRIHAPIHRVVMNGESIRYSIGVFSFMNNEIAIPEENTQCSSSHLITIMGCFTSTAKSRLGFLVSQSRITVDFDQSSPSELMLHHKHCVTYV